MPGAFISTAKRSRSSTPARDSQPDVTPTLQPPSASLSPPSTSSSSVAELPVRRPLASLPRKSRAAPSLLSSPERPTPSNLQYSSPKVYPALPPPSPFSEGSSKLQTASEATSAFPVFTFTCPPPSSTTTGPSSKPDSDWLAPLGPNQPVSSTLSASASVLASLNARLLAAGKSSATLAAPGSSSISTSSSFAFGETSAAGLLRNKKTEVTIKGAERFEKAHQTQWKKDNSIAQHWSLGRRAGGGALQRDGGNNDHHQDKRARVASSSTLEHRPMAQISPKKDIAEGSKVAQVTQQQPIARPTPSSPAKMRLMAKKSRSSISAAGGAIKKRVLGGGTPLSRPMAATATNGLLRKPLPTPTSQTAMAGTVRGAPPARPASPLSVARSASTTLPSKAPLAERHASQQNASLFRSTSMAKTTSLQQDPAKKATTKPQLPAASSVRSTPTSSSSSRPMDSAKANALRVLEARRRAAEESRKRIQLQKMAASS